MDKYRKKVYNYKQKDEVILMAITAPKVSRCEDIVKTNVHGKASNNKKRSAREIAKEIGVHGAFGHSLTDLYKQGR